MSFMSVMVYHAMTVHALLPGEDDLLRAAAADDCAPDALLASLPKQFGRKEAVLEGEKMGLSSRTVDRKLSLLLEGKQIVRISAGHFQKV